MPNNKKKRKNAKKGSVSKDGATMKEIIKSRVKDIFARCSPEIAKELEQRFRSTYPPTHPLDAMPRHKQRLLDYGKVSDTFNAGLRLIPKPTGVDGLARWHLVMEKMADALDIIIKNEDVQFVFLEATGKDHRSLLCSVVCTIAQSYNKMSLYEYVKPWAKAAIAADPTYYKGYSQLSTSLIWAEDDWERANMNIRKAYDLGRMRPGYEKEMAQVKERVDLIDVILNGSKKESLRVKKEYIKDNQGTAMRFWQDMNISRPAKTCEFCFCRGDSKCSKCQAVFYCSRRCQRLDYADHKVVCVEPSKENLMDIIKTPNFSRDEMCDEVGWSMMKKSAKAQGISLLMTTANNCILTAVKRAIMEGGDVNEKCPKIKEYPVHVAALRREPEDAVDIVRTLIQHGACPNVVRGDGEHLLAICQKRAMWIDDNEPSMGNRVFQMTHNMVSHLSKELSIEQVERRESVELVQLVTAAIRQHKLCNHCKARKRMKGIDAHLMGGDLTGRFLSEKMNINDKTY